ncbi:MAG: DUF4359 domain-containing protein [Cyanobacteria bacterium P01_D01_bin.1]
MKLGSAIALLSVVALGGALVVTNPDQDDYAAYLSQTVSTEAKVALCNPESFTNWLGRVGAALSQACQGLLAGGETLSEAEVQTLIKENTDYSNRLFFSTYITQTPFGNYRAIGVFNRFIMQPSENNETGISETEST